MSFSTAKCREVFIVGLGAIGAPLATYLLNLGLQRFVLCDPKLHKPENVRSQCELDEVGRRKVKTASRQLRRLGAKTVVAWPLFVEHVEPGWVGPDSIVVACADRLGAVRAASDLALAFHAPFFRVNIEPRYSLATLSGFDYRAPRVRSCALCSWGDAEFRAQEQVTSCAPSVERPTGSPRALAALAAGWAALTIAQAVEPPAGASDSLVWNHVLSFTTARQSVLPSAVTGRGDCGCQLEKRVRPVRLAGTPRTVSLQTLVARGGFDAAKCWVRGSGAIVRRARCTRCAAEIRGCWWVRREQLSGRCACGGSLEPARYDTLTSFRRHEVGRFWDAPLADMGTGRKATVELTEGSRQLLFVLA